MGKKNFKAYCLSMLPRHSPAPVLLPHRQGNTHNCTPLQPRACAPFVFDNDTPWGWLEYHRGNFQGQRLALKRSLVTIGRDEDNDIWIDDDMASRHHAELIYKQGQVYLTDCDSLNGVLINGQPLHGTALLSSNAILEIGQHLFRFMLADQRTTQNANDDPLAKRISLHGLPLSNEPIPLPSALPFTTPPPPSPPDRPALSNGPIPLRLPSKQKKS